MWGFPSLRLLDSTLGDVESVEQQNQLTVEFVKANVETSEQFTRFLVVPVINRCSLLACVFAIGFFNSIAGEIYAAVVEDGLLNSVLKTFGISVIVWVSAFIAFEIIGRGSKNQPSRLDWLISGGAVGCFMLPSSPLGWIVLSLFAAFTVLTSGDDEQVRKGALIFGAIAVPMFWSRLLFALFSGWILQADAVLVSLIVGMDRAGNTIQLPNGNGQLWIAAGCSSLANISLAILCCSVFLQYVKSPKIIHVVSVVAITCLAVVAINVARLCLIAVFPDQYGLIHGPIGASLVSCLTTLAMVGICMVGFRRDAVV